MSLMDLFKPAAPAPAPVADPVAATNTTLPAGQVPPATTTQGAPDNNPLDTFKDIWTPPAADGKPAGVEDMFNIDPKQLMEAASKVDFARMIPQDQMQAIAAGGQGAAEAFAKALNTVAQNVYAQSAAANTKIMQQALARQREDFTGQLPNLVKTHTLSESIRESNPALSHPAAAPLISAIQQTLQLKHPTATNAELQKMAQEYVSGFANAVSGPKQADPVAEDKSNTDWSKYI